jgi:hypothetical protein
MHRWPTAVIAALAAAVPILAGELHGWSLVGLAFTAGIVGSLALPPKKSPSMSRNELGLIRSEY